MDSRLFLYRILIELSRSEAIYRRRRSVSSRGFARTRPPTKCDKGRGWQAIYLSQRWLFERGSLKNRTEGLDIGRAAATGDNHRINMFPLSGAIARSFGH